MDSSKLTRLPTIQVEKPCPEDWEAMEGNDQRRFCQGCGCYVHNLTSMTAEEAEATVSQPGRVCIRMKLHAQKGIRVRDGWIPRLLAIGALAAGAVGCAEPAPKEIDLTGSVAPSAMESNNVVMGDVEPPKETTSMGKVKIPEKETSDKN